MMLRANMARQVLILLLLLLPLGGCERWRAEWAYHDALSSLREGDYDRARTVFLQVATAFPDHPRAPEAMYRRMRLMMDQLGEVESAELAFRDLLRRYPESIFSQRALQEAIQKLLIQRRGARKGLKLVDFYLSHFPEAKDRLEMRRNMAQFFAREGHFQQAQIELEQALRLAKNRQSRAKILFARAEISFYSGSLSNAIGFARQIQSDVQGDLPARARYIEALALEEDGQLDRALNQLFEVQDAYPNPRVIAEKIVALQERIKRRKR